MLIRRNKPCTSTGNSERNRYSSENNEPVIGASVLVKGTTNGTITDINGQFTLTNISPTNKTIIVSFIGMETQEVTIKPEMKIVMTSQQK